MEEDFVLERTKRRHALAEIEKLIKKSPNLHIEPSELKVAATLVIACHMHRISTPIIRHPLANIENLEIIDVLVNCWNVSTSTGTLWKHYPHFKVILGSEANGDGRLLRGEIMTITGIMVGRLRSKRLRPHVVAPMLVLSLMGHCHARVLEADFDGKILNIRASKLYDFTQKNTEFVHSLTRYWLGGACGKIEL
ncbi:hypothetical protein DTO013E5_1170 [Penicillium roqueforti]|nr:hypothetical protein LCP963914a_6412 [Penicillium roqueforti]KAI2702064.1 hypothetical protein CBS147372_3797 [Penicillium roqueforti]KAI2747455.1 hypothetical protein DTO012A1_101 [Penicillium roqueforti]KAI2748514.1 hypothetical protein DTO013F2_6485 [Penicillium roqueforti]KAI2775197.1 hypothetical protein DTO012A8_682 [Penicillium roqueforti]